MSVSVVGSGVITPTGAGQYTGGSITIPAGADAIYVFFSGGNGSTSTEVNSITLGGNSPGKLSKATVKANNDGSTSAIAADSIRCGVAAWRTSVTGTGAKTLALTWANAPTDGAAAGNRIWNILWIAIAGNDVSSDSSLWRAAVPQAADWFLQTTANTIANVSANSGDFCLTHDSGYDSLPSTPSGWTSQLTQATTVNIYASRISSLTATGAYSVASTGAAWDALTSIAIATAPQSLAPTGIASTEAFGTAALSIDVAVTAIASAEAFGSPTVEAVTTIGPSGIASSEAFGDATLTSAATVSPSSIPSEETFGAPTVSPGAVTIAPSGIGSSEAFGDSTLNAGTIVSASGIASTEAFGDATVSSAGVITPTGIASAEAMGTPALNLEIAVSSIASAETFGSAALKLEIVVSSIASAEAFGTPSVTAGDVSISPTGISSAEAFGDLQIAPEGSLLIPGIASAELFGTPAIETSYNSGYHIDGENEVLLETAYGSITLYSDGAGEYFSIGGSP